MMRDKRMLKFTPFMIGDALTKNVIAGLFVPMMVLTLESQTDMSSADKLNKCFYAILPTGAA